MLCLKLLSVDPTRPFSSPRLWYLMRGILYSQGSSGLNSIGPSKKQRLKSDLQKPCSYSLPPLSLKSPGCCICILLTSPCCFPLWKGSSGGMFLQLQRWRSCTLNPQDSSSSGGWSCSSHRQSGWPECTWQARQPHAAQVPCSRSYSSQSFNLVLLGTIFVSISDVSFVIRWQGIVSSAILIFVKSASSSVWGYRHFFTKCSSASSWGIWHFIITFSPLCSSATVYPLLRSIYLVSVYHYPYKMEMFSSARCGTEITMNYVHYAHYMVYRTGLYLQQM